MEECKLNNSKLLASSTILLIRDTLNGLEVFMIERNKKIDIAPGALVFPGGKVEPEDYDPELLDLCGGSSSDQDAIASKVCAIRETFEESGVLIAKDYNSDKLIDPLECFEFAKRYRKNLQEKKITLLEILKKEKLILATEMLTSFSRWITPRDFPKRFDTNFYLIPLTAEFSAEHDGYESVNSLWVSPQKALSDADKGLKTIVFATRMNLLKLGGYKDTQSVVNDLSKALINPVEPKVETVGDNIVFKIPKEAGYGLTKHVEIRNPNLFGRKNT